MFHEQQSPLKIVPPLTTQGGAARRTPNARRRYDPYDTASYRAKNAMYDDHEAPNTVQHPGAGAYTGFSLGDHEVRPPAAMAQNTPTEWSPAFHPPAGEAELAGFGGATNQWMPLQRPESGYPAIMQDEWNHSNSLPDTSFAFQGNANFTSKSVISPHLYSCTTPWDPVVASIPYQCQIAYPPMNYPQEQPHGPEKPSLYFSNCIAPSNPVDHSSQLGPTVCRPHQSTFPPPPHPTALQSLEVNAEGSSMDIIGGFGQQLRGAAPTHSNVLNYRQEGPLADGDQVNYHYGTDDPVEMQVHTVQVQSALTGQTRNWGQSQDVSQWGQQALDSNPGCQAPIRSHSFPSTDFNLQTGTMQGPPPIHTESASQRARSVESFFVKHKQLSRPPPIMTLPSATTNPIDTSLRKFQHGASLRYEQNSAYAMLWPPRNIEAAIGDLFVNTDSVTSGRRAWIRDGTGWAPINIAHAGQ